MYWRGVLKAGVCGLSQDRAAGMRKSGSLSTPSVSLVFRRLSCTCESHVMVQAEAVSLPERPKCVTANGWPVRLVFVVQHEPRRESLAMLRLEVQMRCKSPKRKLL